VTTNGLQVVTNIVYDNVGYQEPGKTVPDASTMSLQTVNSDPIAVPDELSVIQNHSLNVGKDWFLTNDLDPDGDPIAPTGVGTTSAEGAVVALAADLLTYTPVTDFTGRDTFTYTISDDRGGTNTAIVNLTVLPIAGAATPVVYGPELQGDEFVVRFEGVPGYTYTVESADDLEGPWGKVANLRAPTSGELWGTGIFEFRENIGARRQRFYRTVFPSY
jgi:hypothetical protein